MCQIMAYAADSVCKLSANVLIKESEVHCAKFRAGTRACMLKERKASKASRHTQGTFEQHLSVSSRTNCHTLTGHREDIAMRHVALNFSLCSNCNKYRCQRAYADSTVVWIGTLLNCEQSTHLMMNNEGTQRLAWSRKRDT
jgi:hypothetical protein